MCSAKPERGLLETKRTGTSYVGDCMGIIETANTNLTLADLLISETFPAAGASRTSKPTWTNGCCLRTKSLLRLRAPTSCLCCTRSSLWSMLRNYKTTPRSNLRMTFASAYPEHAKDVIKSDLQNFSSRNQLPPFAQAPQCPLSAQQPHPRLARPIQPRRG